MNIMTRQHQNGHDKFKNRSLVHFRHMEGTLQQRHAEMSKRWDNLDQEWTNLEKKMSEVGLSMSWASLEDKMSEAAVSMRSPRTPDPVVLNVGGSEVYVPHFVLEGLQQSSGPHTFFGDLFRGGVWDERLPRDSDGQVFLDENPACFQHLVQTLSKRFVKMGACSDHIVKDLPADELRYLPHVADALGLSTGMTVTGGSTVLENFDADALTVAIRGWCPGEPGGLQLLYRASRDGWTLPAFLAKSGESAPTITLVRVKSTENTDSVVGGFNGVPWSSVAPNGSAVSPGVFLFMLNNGDSGGVEKFRWGPTHGSLPTVSSPSPQTIAFGAAGMWDLLVALRASPTLHTGNRVFDIPPGSPFLALSSRPIVEVEIFAVGSMAAVPVPSPPPAENIEVKLVDSSTSHGAASSLVDEHDVDEHEDDVHRFGGSIADSLNGERIALRHAQTELAKASAQATASVQALAAVYGPNVAKGEADPVISLSVHGCRGSKRMSTLLSTIQTCEPEFESVLAVRFQRWSKNDSDKDAYGWQINNCSPNIFAKLLDVLRMKKRTGWDSSREVRGSVVVKGSDRSSFEELVNMYFPGCESFIMDCVEFQEESRAP